MEQTSFSTITCNGSSRKGKKRDNINVPTRRRRVEVIMKVTLNNASRIISDIDKKKKATRRKKPNIPRRI